MDGGGIFRGLEQWDPEPLRRQFRKGGFHREALELLALPERWLNSPNPHAALGSHAAEGSPIHTLIRLFTLGDAVEGDLAFRVLGDAAPGLAEMGFIRAQGGEVRSLYQICPVDHSWVACDFLQRQAEDRPDYVMGVGQSSALLASLTPPAQGRALELGCGIGWLSGKLAAAGMGVTATDFNPRALELARFTSILAGTRGVDFRHGDGFSGVAGETFDLIVSNPPYVCSPGGHLIYREGGGGGPVCEDWLRQIPDYLTDDGVAVMLLNWTHATDGDWSDGPLSWVRPDGMRRWLFQTECNTPAAYAWRWVSGDPRFQGGREAAEVARWLEFYQENNNGRVSGGFMVVQRCDPGHEWTRTESRGISGVDLTAGAEVRRILRNQTWLETSPDLLGSRYIVPAGIRAEADMTLGDSGWERRTIRLTSPARLSYDGQVDENMLRLLALVREGASPSAMVDEIRSRPEFAEMTDLAQRIEGLVRELVRHGVLEPVQ